MPLRPSDVRVPPERYSTRIRSLALNQPDTLHANPAPSRAKPSEFSVAQQTVVSRIPVVTRLKEERDSSDVDEDTLSDVNESEDGETFVSRQKLPGSSVQRWKLEELKDRIDTGWIDLNPEYQREVVWNTKAMSGLINSLIEDYYIPPIIFNLQEEIQENGTRKQRRICVDGKQRLSSVHAFMQGTIPCTDRRGNPWYYRIPLDNDNQPIRERRNRRIWSEQLRHEFRNKSFVSYEFKDLTRIQEEDLFARVQKGLPLTAAEKLHASSGPWQDLAKQYEEEFKNVVGLSVSNRSTGFRNILTAFSQITENRNPSNSNGTPQMKIQMPSIQKLCSKNQRLLEAPIKAHLHAVFAKFHELAEMDPKIFQNNNYKVARNFAPIETVAVAVLISEYMDSRNNHMLLGDIHTMRSTIREHLPDLRMDHVTWKTIWQFISELESFRGAADGSNVPKKVFKPKRVTNRELSRVNQSQRLPMQQIIESRLPALAVLPNTASAAQSIKSTPLSSPISAVSSHSFILPRNQPETDTVLHERSSSEDSVLGEHLKSPRRNHQSGEIAVTTPIPQPSMMSSTFMEPTPRLYSTQVVAAAPGLKVEAKETSWHKRPFPLITGAIAPGARALQAKRARLASNIPKSES